MSSFLFELNSFYVALCVSDVSLNSSCLKKIKNMLIALPISFHFYVDSLYMIVYIILSIVV